MMLMTIMLTVNLLFLISIYVNHFFLCWFNEMISVTCSFYFKTSSFYSLHMSFFLPYHSQILLYESHQELTRLLTSLNTFRWTQSQGEITEFGNGSTESRDKRKKREAAENLEWQIGTERMRLDTVDVMLQTMNREWNILEGERDSVWSRKKNVKNKNTRWVGWRQPETKKKYIKLKMYFHQVRIHDLLIWNMYFFK